MNAACEQPLTLDLLPHSFENNWGFLEDALKQIRDDAIPTEEAPATGQRKALLRDDTSMIQEVLELTRGLYAKQQLAQQAQGTGLDLFRRRAVMRELDKLSKENPGLQFELHDINDGDPNGYSIDVIGQNKRRRLLVNSDEPSEVTISRLIRAVAVVAKGTS